MRDRKRVKGLTTWKWFDTVRQRHRGGINPQLSFKMTGASGVGTRKAWRHTVEAGDGGNNDPVHQKKGMEGGKLW